MPQDADLIDVSRNTIENRIASRLAALRMERGWTLEALALRTGISRASLSRLERGELSPTSAMLLALCEQYGWTLSRLMTEAENRPPSVVTAKEQVHWKDPETGYIRRVISPPNPDLKGELVEVTLPAGSSVSVNASYQPGLEHHLWILEGAVSIEVDGKAFSLEKGDCLRFVLASPSKFVCGKRQARYLIALVHA